MHTQPYMPDSARAAMPNSPMQPLPPYLREDFSQSLDRTRPHELVIRMHKGKPVNPSRCSCLLYRYTDTGETATVPNIWYNQTLEMRLSHWMFETERTANSLQVAKNELALIESWSAPYYRGDKTEKALQRQRWHVEELQRLADSVAQVLADVQAGIKFA